MAMNQNQFPTFQTVDFHHASWTRWAGSVGLHTFAIALLIMVPYTAHEIVQVPQSRVTPLYEPAPYRPHITFHRAPIKQVVVKQIVKQIPPPPVKQRMEFRLPPKQIVIPVKQVTVQEPPAAPAPRLEMAKLELPKIDVPAIPKPAPVVKTGGFGNPEGALPSTASNKSGLSAPRLGAFDLPAGESHGRGSGARQVAMAGFGDGSTIGTGSGGNSHGSIRTGGFGTYQTAAAVSRTVQLAAPAETPVEITYKPKPAYTAEAREKRIQGEVLLEVLFSASGRIEVLRVTRGLGFGLDENARAAASQIRFQPGTRGGAPVDMKGTVHIVFELS